MKTNDVEMVEDYEETARIGMKRVRAYLLDEGDNQVDFKKAKIGAMAMGAYTRLRATRANERALVLAAKRQQLTGIVEPAELSRQLPAKKES